MSSRTLWTRLRRVRQAVQILALAFYVYLLFAALQRRGAFPLADLAFRLDPLGALSAMIATRAWLPRLGLALATLGLTLVLGRVWCGWLCPLGTLLGWIRFGAANGRSGRFSTRWQALKNVILLLILSMALFGSLTLLILDPLALLTRTMTTAILPALNHAITSIERVLYQMPAAQPVVDVAERLLRGPVLPVVQAVFVQNVLIAALFVGVVGLNALADRFWCRYLCPLGALLGLLSKVSFLRPVFGAACNRCGQCVGACRLDAIDTREGYEILPSECTLCLDCFTACPESGLRFRWHWRPDPVRMQDPTRRQFLAGLAASAVGVALLRTGARAKQPTPHLVRPPGVDNEGAFLARCLRCSQCMKVCPTSGLQPVLTEAGGGSLWTPRLVSRLGYCDYGCNACGQVCPSGAIPPLSLEDKRGRVMGVAVVDRNRCLPWAEGVPCIVCEEMCPVPDKAVKLEESELAEDESGSPIPQRPFVRPDLCIGCGICEYQCPVAGESAIRVYRT